MTSTNSSPTLNGPTCTYRSYEVPDVKTEKRVEVVVPLLTLSYYYLFLAIFYLFIHISINLFIYLKQMEPKHPLEYNGLGSYSERQRDGISCQT